MRTRQTDWDRAVVFLGWRAPAWLAIATGVFWPLWGTQLVLACFGSPTPGWLHTAVIALGWAQIAALAVGLPRLVETARLSRELRGRYGLRKDLTFVLAAAPRIPRQLRRETLSDDVSIAVEVGDFIGLLPGRRVMVIRDEQGVRLLQDDPASTAEVLTQLRAIPRGAAIHRVLRAK